MRKRKQPKKIAKDTAPPTRMTSNNSPATTPQRRRMAATLTAAGVIVVALVIVAAATLPTFLQRQNQRQTTTPSSSGGFASPPTDASATTTQWGTYQLHETVPHDPSAFTQGFLTVQVDDDDSNKVIYEGTGMWGDSELRILAMDNGTVISRRSIPDRFFGEGITQYPTETGFGLLQLTWKARVVLEYDTLAPLTTPEHTSEFMFTSTRNEGWGITYDPVDHVFWVSDGSSVLHKWNATDRAELATVPVTYRLPSAASALSPTAQPLGRLNELEWDPATRTILANVWGQDSIARIDPTTGLVRTLYDCSTLFVNRPASADVFNGIALTYDVLRETVDTNQVWVTGKYWPNTYRISLVDP